MNPYLKKAVITVTDNNFIKGTLVLIYSFLQKNTWFNGDIIILSNDLTDNHKQQLTVFPNIIFRNIGEELLKRIKILCFYLPAYQATQRRFYSLEAFNLINYDKLLFLDSDILCCGDVKPIVHLQEFPLVASPDHQYYLGKKKDRITFLPITKEESSDSTSLEVFNSGMMVINPAKLSDDTYKELLKLLNPVVYKNNQTFNTDQYLLNLYFEQNVEFTDYRYNYLLHAKDAINVKENPNLDEVVFIHFSNMKKPWLREEKEKDKYVRLWKKHYQQYLAEYE